LRLDAEIEHFETGAHLLDEDFGHSVGDGKSLPTGERITTAAIGSTRGVGRSANSTSKKPKRFI
jgi:hypothetical protein